MFGLTSHLALGLLTIMHWESCNRVQTRSKSAPRVIGAIRGGVFDRLGTVLGPSSEGPNLGKKGAPDHVSSVFRGRGDSTSNRGFDRFRPCPGKLLVLGITDPLARTTYVPINDIAPSANLCYDKGPKQNSYLQGCWTNIGAFKTCCVASDLQQVHSCWAFTEKQGIASKLCQTITPLET